MVVLLTSANGYFGDKIRSPPILSKTTHIVSRSVQANASLCVTVSVPELGDRLGYEYFWKTCACLI
jgi:hypothetical protein